MKCHREIIESGNFRPVKGLGCLTSHELNELDEDFGIEIDPDWAHVLAVLNREEWKAVRKSRKEA